MTPGRPESNRIQADAGPSVTRGEIDQRGGKQQKSKTEKQLGVDRIRRLANRLCMIDEVPDDPLQRADMASIVDIQLARLGKLLADRKITLELDEAARAWLANMGYDPAYGARPLKRVIQRNVQDPLAERILAGTVKDGDAVHLTVRDGTLVINGEAVRMAAEWTIRRRSNNPWDQS